ncbi:hypothetical protein, partial [Vibrio cholerae]
EFMDSFEYHSQIREKTLGELNLFELAHIHVNSGVHTSLKSGYMISSLNTVIDEIRHVKYQAYSSAFLPVSAAFTVLDQLGFCYINKNLAKYSDANASSIKKSLYYFCGFGMNDKDSKTLYALRNSFIHSASGVSKALRSNQPNHYFVFDKSNPNLITYPTESWDGNFSNLKMKHATIVNQKMLVDLAESAVDKVKEALYNDALQVELEGAECEFYYRFLKHIEN